MKQTAYPRDRNPRSKRTKRLTGWNPKIVELYDLGYQFLGFEYSEPGWLYRAGLSALREVASTGEIGHFDGEKSFTELERELGIYLVSQDFSDSYSVTRFWEGTRDSYIAAFKSTCFNRELRAGRAAVLGFAEPGFVFKYPFLTRPLALSDVDFLIVPAQDFAELQASQARQMLVAAPNPLQSGCPNELRTWLGTKFISPAIEPDAALNRRSYEKALNDLLDSLGIKSAVALPSTKFPKAG